MARFRAKMYNVLYIIVLIPIQNNIDYEVTHLSVGSTVRI